MEERTRLWIKEREWVLGMKNSEGGSGGVVAHKGRFSGTFLLVICLDTEV